MPHVLDLKRAQVAGRQLLAANDPHVVQLQQPVQVHGVGCVLSRNAAGYAMHTADGSAVAQAETRLQAVADAALVLQVQANRRDPHCEGAY